VLYFRTWFVGNELEKGERERGRERERERERKRKGMVL